MKKKVFLTSVSLIFLSGCSPDPLASDPAQTQTQTQTQTKTKTQSPTVSDQGYSAGDFRAIAEDSCARALEFGVSEIEAGLAGFEQVLVPKEQGYEGYSAAYFQPPETYELIYETDWFSVCAASNTYALSEEAGVESGIMVEFLVEDSVFETTQDFGEFGVSVLRYSVAGGYFSQVSFIEADEVGVVSISYGPLSNDQKQVIKTAVDRLETVN